MNADSEKSTPRRRRSQPRRLVPATIEQRERRPVAFGWGADLTDRERESLKERIALLAGIVLAVIIGGLLGWGLLYDNVIHPNQLADQNNKPVAIIGVNHPYVITTGFFKALAAYNNTSNTNRIQQLQSQLAQYQAQPKKNAVIIQQIDQQITIYQQSLQNLAQSSLNSILADQTVIQRSWVAGVKITPKLRAAAYTQLMKGMGGPRELATFIKTSGMTRDETLMINLGDYIRTGPLSAALAKSVKPFQTKVRASHILVKTQKEANSLLTQIRHGANFAALAKKFSIDTGSKLKGGDLGYFAKGTMVAPFDKAAFSMKIGQIRVVHSQFGYHIIKVTGRQTVHLTAVQLQQAQQNALPQWIAQQQAILRVQNIVSTKNLPAVPTPNPSVLAAPAGSTSTTGAPSVTGSTGKPITITHVKAPAGSHPVTSPANGSKSTTKTKKP